MGLTTTTLLLLLQQGFTTPPAGDTTGYWQQRVEYTIVARLDEAAQKVSATATMRYVNNSPDTLRELYVHQHLNAFRPHSRWSDADDREGRVRFQKLRDPDYGYERFTAPVRVNGAVAAVTYPGAPDSTVARIALPAPLIPGDSVDVLFAWDARTSIPPRRQGRRGRHWDLAQWYPRIAPYDRGGWQFNALQPAGEFYGEFGSYDVTLVVREDQVIGATGVPVSGDPGWERARRSGVVHRAASAYGTVPPAPRVEVPEGHKAVRFVARDVHHFAWSTSPDYRYEGAVYARRPPPGRVRAWDSVAIHVLYQPGDDTTWGGGRVVQRTANSLAWLESIFGRYAYPQMTVLHRVEGGGTEFPMMQMNGSPSQGLNLHEGGHVWVHGILANNEWRRGWLDEGFTSYQTDWAQNLTPQERVRAGAVDRFVQPTGYRARGISMAIPRFDATGLGQSLTDLEGDAEPIGTVAHEFRDFGTYNQMIYTRAQVMYGQLRDALGESAWTGFLDDYYQRWALKHVDERAMRGSAERVSGRELGWFFDQWVHRTGVMDYALSGVRHSRSGARWVTEAAVTKKGEYAHPIAVGVRTTAGWTTARITVPGPDRQTVRIETDREPLEVRLDPHHFSWDWDRRNDVSNAPPIVNLDWPFLRQAHRERPVALIRPLLWYGDPAGVVPAIRLRSSYLDLVDRYEMGMAYATGEVSTGSRIQGWARVENPYLPFFRRPLIGWGASAGKLDDVVLLDGSHRAEFRGARMSGWYGGRITFSRAMRNELRPLLWSTQPVVDYTLDVRPRWRRASGERFMSLRSTVGVHASAAFVKSELALGTIRSFGTSGQARLRLYGGFAEGGSGVPAQRALLLSAEDPVSTYRYHWWRPRDGVLQQDFPAGLPLGGAGLRGYHWVHAASSVIAANADLSRALHRTNGREVRLHAFYDVASSEPMPGRQLISDAGIGLGLRGRIFDRDVNLRLDAPFYVSKSALARTATDRQWSPRYVLSFRDIWFD